MRSLSHDSKKEQKAEVIPGGDGNKWQLDNDHY